MTRLTTSILLAMLVLIGAASRAGATPLGDLAASMEPGEWAELATTDIDAVLVAGGASQFEIGYSEDIVWDPVTRRLFFVGGDHADVANFITWSDDTSTWEELPRPSWIGSGTMHGYDHSAIDPERRFLYHRPFGANTVHRYAIDDASWTVVPDAPNNGTSCCDALTYFPEMDGLLWAHHSYGELQLFSEDTQDWTLLDTLPAGSTWNVAEHNPVHGFVVFAYADTLYRLASDGEVTPLGTLGVSIYDGSGFNGVLTVDPVTGDHIVSTPGTDQRTFHVFDAVDNLWAPLPTQPDLDLTRTAMVGTPVSTYGVTLFVWCKQSTPCGVLVYKHAPFDIPPLPDGGPRVDGGGTPARDGGGVPRSDGSPAVDDGGPGDRTSDGCGCRAAPGRPFGGALVSLVIALAGARRVRRRAGAP